MPEPDAEHRASRQRCGESSGAGCTAALRAVGSPPGNRKAFKHGRYSAGAIAQRREVAVLLRACRDQLGAMCDV